MAATVVTSAVASSNRFPDGHEGLIPFWGTVEVATTSLDEAGDDVLLCGPFPEQAYLYSGSGSLALKVFTDDLDSDGTPALVLDFGVGDSDGAIDTVLINDTTVGQAGGVDEIDTVSTDNIFIDVGGKYLIMTVVTAAATAAAGTVSFGGFYVRGVEQLS